MSRQNPYDTGERLEPKPWYPERADPDTYGRVDFEGDAGETEFTVCAKRDPEAEGGFLLEIDNHGGRPIRMVVNDEAGWIEPTTPPPPASVGYIVPPPYNPSELDEHSDLL